MAFDSTNPDLKSQARYGSDGKSGGPNHPMAAKARASRVAVDQLLADPNFNRSLAASRQRLEDALAIASTLALRLLENGGTSSDTMSMLKESTAIYRQLSAQDESSLEQRPGESNEDYRARLTRAAGK